mmetsp:Transcript_16982/g.31799  ORF Transcript_16982/g.31799 Transcript_16982/m.31799 type:complete len:214 (-) Transcript_16982:121-762(-)
MEIASSAPGCTQQMQSSNVSDAYNLLLLAAIDSLDVAAILSAMRGLSSNPEAQARAIEGLFNALGSCPDGEDSSNELFDIFQANAGLWTLKDAIANHAMAHNEVARHAVLLIELITHIPKPVKAKVGLAYVRWPTPDEIRNCMTGGTNIGQLFQSMDPSLAKSLKTLVEELMEAWPEDLVLQAAGRSMFASIEEQLALRLAARATNIARVTNS